LECLIKMFQKFDWRNDWRNICDTWVIFLVRLWSVVGKNIRKKCWFDHSSPYKTASIQKKTAKNLYSAFDPLNSLHQINLTFFFSFHIFIFSHSKSIDYIMIILELISPQTAHYWAKILAYYTKKITIIKKKRRPNIVTALLPARDQLQKQQKKSQFLVTWPDKKT